VNLKLIKKKKVIILLKYQNKKGFTMIEIILVIAVLGILASIAIPRYGGFKDKATEGVFIADVGTMERIITYYSLSRSDEPNTEPDNPGSMTDAEWNQYAKDHLNDFISGGWPTQTPWGGFFTYRAYPAGWEYIDNWKRVYDSNAAMSEVVDENKPFEIIMIRFQNPSDEEGFDKAMKAFEDSAYREKIYRYNNQLNIGIPVVKE